MDRDGAALPPRKAARLPESVPAPLPPRKVKGDTLRHQLAVAALLSLVVPASSLAQSDTAATAVIPAVFSSAAALEGLQELRVEIRPAGWDSMPHDLYAAVASMLAGELRKVGIQELPAQGVPQDFDSYLVLHLIKVARFATTDYHVSLEIRSPATFARHDAPELVTAWHYTSSELNGDDGALEPMAGRAVAALLDAWLTANGR